MLLRSTGLFKDSFRTESASKCGLASQIVKLMHYSGNLSWADQGHLEPSPGGELAL
jgi:hypothetical protein